MGRGGGECEEGRGAWRLRLTRPFRRVAVKMFRHLSAKFMVGVGGILVITLALSIFVNTQVVERYYLRRQTGYVEAAGQRLEALIDQLPLGPGEFLHQLPAHIQHVHGALVEFKPPLGDREIPCGSDNQAGMQLFFQRTHVGADRGLGQVETAGRLGKTIVIHHGNKCLQLLEFHFCTPSISHLMGTVYQNL